MAVRVWNQTIDPDCMFAGTLTCLARMANDPAHLVALTAAHVVAPLVRERDRVPRPQVGNDIVFDLGNREHLMGKLWFWADLQRQADQFSNDADLALIDIDAAHAPLLLNALAQPNVLAHPERGESLQFTGVASAATLRGTFEGGRWGESIFYGELGGPGASVLFTNALVANISALEGDSGSLMTNSVAGVGLLIAGDNVRCQFLALAPLFQMYGLEWINASTLSAPLSAASASVPLPGSIVPDRALALDTLARTLWGEARGESLLGLRAVAGVVINRTTHPRIRWWGRTIVGVCRAGKQFSCWNADDGNYPRLMRVTTADDKFRLCLQVATEALDGRLEAERMQHNATHYHNKTVTPYWIKGKLPCADIGGHLFYNNID